MNEPGDKKDRKEHSLEAQLLEVELINEWMNHDKFKNEKK